jgi:hypothetical protein
MLEFLNYIQFNVIKMIFRPIICLFILFNSTFSFATKIPTDPIEEVDDQIARYRAAYNGLRTSATFKPETTPIPGLIPLVRMGYSYVRGHLVHHKDTYRKSLLKKFWLETEKSMGTVGLTIQAFKATNLRLAVLAARGQIVVSRFGSHSGIAELTNKSNWHDLQRYRDQMDPDVLKVFPTPFCFEAILYHRPGSLEYVKFMTQYLHSDFPLGLSVFPTFRGASSDKTTSMTYCEYTSDSFSSLFQDFFKWHSFASHWTALANPVEGWDPYWRVVTTILDKDPKSKFIQAALHMLLHEIGFPPHDSTAAKRGNSPPSKSLTILPKNGTTSQQTLNIKVFRNWVTHAKKVLSEKAAAEEEVFTQNINGSLSVPELSEMRSKVVWLRKPENGKYKIQLNLFCLNNRTSAKKRLANHENLCTLGATVTFAPLPQNAFEETMAFNNLVFSEWNGDLLKNLSGCCTRYTPASVGASITRAFTTTPFLVPLSRRHLFESTLREAVEIYTLGRDTQKDKPLSMESSKDEMIDHFTTFLDRFYEQCAPSLSGEAGEKKKDENDEKGEKKAKDETIGNGGAVEENDGATLGTFVPTQFAINIKAPSPKTEPPLPVSSTATCAFLPGTIPARPTGEGKTLTGTLLPPPPSVMSKAYSSHPPKEVAIPIPSGTPSSDEVNDDDDEVDD